MKKIRLFICNIVGHHWGYKSYLSFNNQNNKYLKYRRCKRCGNKDVVTQDEWSPAA